MRIDLTSWLRGAVDIEIKGRFSERFLNLAFQEGIALRDIRRKEGCIIAQVPLGDMGKLRDISRRSRCSFHIRRRIGVPFFCAFLRRRPLLPLWAALAVAVSVFVASLTFTLEVGGPYPVSAADQERVLELAAEMGLSCGRSRWGLDMDEIEKHILLGFNELVFAQIVQEGVHVRIDVVRRVDVPPDEQEQSPGHLVADFDGIIEDVLVRRGTAAVSPGDAVCRGDILIYGWQGEQQLAADGIVTARVWCEGYGECALQEEYSEPSGASLQSLGIRVDGGPFLQLVGPADVPYDEYSLEETTERTLLWRNTGPTVEIISRQISELIAGVNEYNAEQAQTIAATRAEENAFAALERLLGTAAAESTVLTQDTEELPLDDGPARAHTVLEVLAPIGVAQPLEQN